MNSCFNHYDLRRIVSVEYRHMFVNIDMLSSSTCNSKMTVMRELRTTFLIFGKYSTKRLIELDVTLVRSIAICSNLIPLKAFDEIWCAWLSLMKT